MRASKSKLTKTMTVPLLSCPLAAGNENPSPNKEALAKPRQNPPWHVNPFTLHFTYSRNVK